MNILWRRHPSTGKHHGFIPESPVSLCGYTTKGGPEELAIATGARLCIACEAIAKGERSIVGGAIRTSPPVEAPDPVIEDMEALFRGGPFDGERIMLRVIRTSPVKHKVLEQRYDRSRVAKQLAEQVAAIEGS